MEKIFELLLGVHINTSVGLARKVILHQMDGKSTVPYVTLFASHGFHMVY